MQMVGRVGIGDLGIDAIFGWWLFTHLRRCASFFEVIVGSKEKMSLSLYPVSNGSRISCGSGVLEFLLFPVSGDCTILVSAYISP